MKRAVIVHCWSGTPGYCWYPYARRELEGRGFEVEVPAMPDTDAPDLAKWLPKLREAVGTPDEDTYLVGHSVGCITILRYLESLPAGQRVGGAVLVAGPADDIGYEEIESFFKTPVDFNKAKASVKNGFVAIHSDNDPYVGLKHGETLKKELGAELIVKHDANHFAGMENYGEKDCLELPDVVDAVVRLSSR
ncbi:MAG: alpha/beta fold hydrolase [Minisyncoccia bacterium]|jgi:predicted alpha/beta hydrolase family esterase